MRKFTRREFGKSITSSVAASLVVAPELLSQHAAEQPEDNSAPDVIAGYKLTEEEKSLTAKFLANHEKSMMSLRAQTLSNGFAPAFVFISPIMKGSSGK